MAYDFHVEEIQQCFDDRVSTLHDVMSTPSYHLVAECGLKQIHKLASSFEQESLCNCCAWALPFLRSPDPFEISSQAAWEESLCNFKTSVHYAG